MRFGRQGILYALIFVSAFFRKRAALRCELVAIRSQLSFYKESIRQKKQPRPRFNPAFHLLWVFLSGTWSGWESAADLMQPKTVLKWHKSAFRSPWQNPYVERFEEILRRELLDYVVIVNEKHLRRLLKEYIEEYYHIARPHHGLEGETPFPTDKPDPVTEPSRLVSIPVVVGLHHRYILVAA